ncbi:MAG: heavy-metal-associated domain-containing protein [Proteobacteria bacterium]|nr:heavy-metal-associated domain-containing protein [Pseudomonadota bacterium]
MKKKLSLLVMAGAVLFWAIGIVTAGATKDGANMRAVFKVENLTCGACFSNIRAGLAPLDGYSGMGANLFRKRVAVDFEGPLSADKIEKTITAKGYPATLESVGPIMEKESFAYLNTRQKGPGSGGGCCRGGDPVADPSPTPPGGLPGNGSCCSLTPPTPQEGINR